MTTPTAKFLITAKDASKTAINSVRKNLEGLRKQVFSLKTAIAGVGLGLVSKQFIDAASTSEQYRVRLNALLGSVHESNRLFKDMSEFASRVPFEFEEIMGSATQLSGILRGGVDELNEWMPLIADLAAFSGLSIQTTTEQVSRMLSAGAASANLFSDRGITAMLGFQAGVSVSAEETRIKLMESWTKTGSMFRGTSIELASTWQGLMSKLSDKWFQFRTKIMDSGLFDYIKSIVKVIDIRLGNALSDSSGLAKNVSESIITFFKNAIIGGAKLVDLIQTPLIKIKEQVSELWSGFTSLPGWAQEIGIIGALVGGVKGKAILVIASKFMEETKTTAAWYDAYTSGHIGFFEWMTTGSDSAKQKLSELRKEGSILGDSVGDLPNKIFAPGSVAESANTFLTEVNRVFAELQNKKTNAEPLIGGGGANGEESQAITNARNDAAKQLEILNQSLMDRETVEVNAWFRRQEILDQNLELGNLTDAQHKAQSEQLEKFHQDKLTQLTIQGLTARQKFTQQSTMMQTKQVVGELVNMTQGVAQTNKTMFKINKAAGIANAIINTYQGVTNALAAYPPPLSFAMAAAQLAAGLAQVQAIKSQSFGGGATAPSLASSPGMPVTPVSQSQPTISDQQQGQDRRPQELHITINGVLPTDPDQLDQLAASIAENYRNGGRSPVAA